MKMDHIDMLWTWDEIYKDMMARYGDRVFETDTASIAANKSKWASAVVHKIYGIDRRDLSKKAYHFSYIKFAASKDGEILGIVGGKSQFHHKYASDVLFYDIDLAGGKRAAQVMHQNKLVWYKKKIIILINEEEHGSGHEAFANEKTLQNDYHLYG